MSKPPFPGRSESGVGKACRLPQPSSPLSHSVPSMRYGRVVIVAAVLLSTLWVGSDSAFAQNREDGKQIVRGLVEALVESQLERAARRSNAYVAPRPGVSGPPTAEMSQLRPLIATYAQESATLAALLNTDAVRSFAVRRETANVLHLQSTVTVLKQQVDTERDHRMVIPSFQALNSEWKQISFALQQIPDLSTQSRQAIARIDRINSQCAAILGITEQFDNRDLVRAADLLTADYRVVSDEIGYAPRPSGEHRQLVASLRRLQDRSQLFANMASEGIAFQTVSAEYQSQFSAWQQLRPQLDRFTTPTISRTLSRIQETHQTIHQLLRLDFGVDPSLAQQMAENFRRDLMDLFRSITLEQMLLLYDGRSIATAADTLAGTTQNLADVLARREGPAAVQEAWTYLEDSWQLFAYYVTAIEAPDCRRRMADLARSIDSLRQILGVSIAYDPQAVGRQASVVHSLADHLVATVQQWQARPGATDPSIGRDMIRLDARCRELEILAGSGRNREAASSKCTEVLGLWQQLRPRLDQCNTQERETLFRTADSFTSELVRLHTMLGE